MLATGMRILKNEKRREARGSVYLLATPPIAGQIDSLLSGASGIRDWKIYNYLKLK